MALLLYFSVLAMTGLFKKKTVKKKSLQTHVFWVEYLKEGLFQVMGPSKGLSRLEELCIEKAEGCRC